MSAKAGTYSAPNVNNVMSSLGFKPVDPFQLLGHITSSFGTFLQVLFSWVYFLSELTVLVGAIVFVAGAIGRHGRLKQTGAHIVLYAILGFFVAVLAPGAIMAISSSFHG